MCSIYLPSDYYIKHLIDNCQYRVIIIFISGQQQESGDQVIRFRLKELIADKEYRERRVITISEIAESTGINRMTLSKIANHPGCNTGTDNLDKLCTYFNCRIEQLAEHIPESDS